MGASSSRLTRPGLRAFQAFHFLFKSEPTMTPVVPRATVPIPVPSTMGPTGDGFSPSTGLPPAKRNTKPVSTMGAPATMPAIPNPRATRPRRGSGSRLGGGGSLLTNANARPSARDDMNRSYRATAIGSHRLRLRAGVLVVVCLADLLALLLADLVAQLDRHLLPLLARLVGLADRARDPAVLTRALFGQAELGGLVLLVAAEED